MKTEQLKSWGLNDEQIHAVMRENGRDIEAVKAKFAEFDQLKEQVISLRKTALSAQQADQLKAQAEQWKKQAEETEEKWRKKWETREREDSLRHALHDAGAKNEIAVRALLQEEQLAWDENGKIVGLEEQLSALKCRYGYLFGPEQEPPMVVRPAGAQPDGWEEDRVREIMGIPRFSSGKDDF